MDIIAFLLALLAVGAAAYGFINLTEATWGIGIIALAGVLGIFARLAQASYYNSENRKLQIKIFKALAYHSDKFNELTELEKPLTATRQELRKMVEEKQKKR